MQVISSDFNTTRSTSLNITTIMSSNKMPIGYYLAIELNKSGNYNYHLFA
jgi:hypothetical protein